MRRTIVLLLLSAFLLSCGGGDSPSVAIASSTDAVAIPVTLPHRIYKELLYIGDSVSIYALGYLVPGLYDTYSVAHSPGNASSSEWLLSHLDWWMDGHYPDVIVFNCGLHDITRRTDTGWEPWVPIETYERNLRAIVAKLQAYPWPHKLLWARTTPVVDAMQIYRKNADVIRYNEVADKVMAEMGVPSVDLYGAVFPDLLNLTSDGVHFKIEGSTIIGDAIAAAVLTLSRSL